MIELVKSIFSVLDKPQRKQLLSLQALISLSTLIELAGLGLIAPFMAFVSNPQFLQSNRLIKAFYIYSGVRSPHEFMILSGLSVLAALLTSTLLSILTIRRLSFFAAGVGSEFGNRLYRFYIQKPYIYHANCNSAELLKKISTEITRITDNILQPFVQINARVGTVLLIIIFVFFYNPYIATTLGALLLVVYYALYKAVKWRLARNGQQISEYSEKRLQLMAEGFSSVKELHLLQKTNFYVNEFEITGTIFANAYGSSNSIYNAPRYIVEFIVYGVMIGMIITLLNIYNDDIAKILPVLGVFGVAAIKILPSFQQIYSGTAQIKGNISALNSAKQDLIKSKTVSDQKIEEPKLPKLSGDIIAKNLTFSYNGLDHVFKNLSITIPQKKIVGIAGPSGSGKSTLLDILIGAIQANHGTVTVGGSDINTNPNLQRWRQSIGYVAQLPVLRDATIAENIAFGCHLKNIDFTQLQIAINKAQLSEWIDTLREGYLTPIGERGLQISGGQRQRIAIARALYYDANYLFFDEATSALDGITEQEILKTLLSAAADKTVIMIAHRINTLANCDLIYVINGGKIEDSGTYIELTGKNPLFIQNTESMI